MRIEYEHTDVLQNLEFAVAELYREHPEMTDYAVLRVYEAVLEAYAAEKAGRAPRKLPLSDLEEGLSARIREVSEWRLERSALGESEDGGEGLPPGEPLPLDTLLLCLKRLVKSVNTWTRRSGRQGYLNFMSPFALSAPQ